MLYLKPMLLAVLQKYNPRLDQLTCNFIEKK